MRQVIWPTALRALSLTLLQHFKLKRVRLRSPTNSFKPLLPTYGTFCAFMLMVHHGIHPPLNSHSMLLVCLCAVNVGLRFDEHLHSISSRACFVMTVTKLLSGWVLQALGLKICKSMKSTSIRRYNWLIDMFSSSNG